MVVGVGVIAPPYQIKFEFKKTEQKKWGENNDNGNLPKSKLGRTVRTIRKFVRIF